MRLFFWAKNTQHEAEKKELKGHLIEAVMNFEERRSTLEKVAQDAIKAMSARKQK